MDYTHQKQLIIAAKDIFKHVKNLKIALHPEIMKDYLITGLGQLEKEFKRFTGEKSEEFYKYKFKIERKLTELTKH